MSLPTPPPRYDPQDARETRRQLEQRLARLESLADARYVPLDGSVAMTGDLEVGDDDAEATITIRAGTGTVADLAYRVGSIARWVLRCDTDASLVLQRRGTDGAVVDLPISVDPDTGLVTLADGLVLSGTTATVNGATLARVQASTDAPSGAPAGGVGTIHLQVT